jgi:hypothetical protein
MQISRDKKPRRAKTMAQYPPERILIPAFKNAHLLSKHQASASAHEQKAGLSFERLPLD